ncbi:MAG: TlpA disulfide reductase family protein [Bacteroidota bacterium]
MYKIWSLVFVLITLGCAQDKRPPVPGVWRAVLEVQDEKELPFIFEWNEDNSITIRNADERIRVSNINMKDDSITIEHPVFEGIFKGTYSSEKITGDFIKPSLDRVVPFVMTANDSARFLPPRLASSNANADGEWEMVFSDHSDEDRYIAKGIFTQQPNQQVTGTIRTTTGDYRYLEGVMDGSTLRLSTFDGAHAFLFEAEVKDSLMSGFFYSGNHWKEPFKGVFRPGYELPDENSLTYLKEGYDRFDFSFPDIEGTMVSLSDERFKDKVVVVQIMGTWCPNCLEETKYYTQYLESNPSDELEFVSLAFEYAKTREQAINRLERLKASVGVSYPLLLAQYGSSDKQEANEKLPMLNHVLSYPTTIFIDKKGEVRRIHTGFNGKATGEKYTQFVEEFERFVAELLAE